MPIEYGEMIKTITSTTGKTIKLTKTEELIRIIEHLSKSMEKFKSENDILKRSSPTNLKYMELLKECKRLKKAQHELEIQNKNREIDEKQTEK